MGYTLGMPSLKLSNTAGKGGKHCGNFKKVTEEALEERLGQDLDINHNLTQNNEYLTEIKKAAELQSISETWIKNYNDRVDKENIQIEEEIKKAVNEYNDTHEEKLTKVKALKAINDERRANKQEPLQTKRHIRDDAVVMCATIIKPSAEFMSTLKADDQRQMLLDAYDKLKEIVGESNMKAAVIHYDELVPHLHTFWMPETEDGRLCAKEMHGLKFLGTLNREMPAYLRSKGWDIDDCNAYDAEEEQRKKEEMGEKAYKQAKQEKRQNQGRSSSKFKHEVQKEVEELEKKETELIDSISEKSKKEAEINNNIKEIQEDFEVKKEEITKKLTPLKTELDRYLNLEISAKNNISLEEKKMPLSNKRVSVDITELEKIKQQAQAYCLNYQEIKRNRERKKELDEKEAELTILKLKLQKEREDNERAYNRQLNLNKLLEAEERKVQKLTEENNELKKTVNSLKKKADKLINVIIKAFSEMAAIIKTVKMLKYSNEEYKANLTEDQGILIDAVTQYGKDKLMEIGDPQFNDLAKDISNNTEIDDEISDYIDDLSPTNYISRGRGGMSR